jgi:hypothetical protein
MNADNWLRLDELENAIDNLEMCHGFLATIRSELRWKWAILAWHQALYGFAICAIQGTNGLSVLRDPAKHNSQLISIHEAVERCRDPQFLRPGATPLNMSDGETKAIKRLIKEFRNGFEHFRPAAWSIEASGMPTLMLRGLRVLRGIAINSGSVVYYEDSQQTRVTEALDLLDAILTAPAV